MNTSKSSSLPYVGIGMPVVMVFRYVYVPKVMGIAITILSMSLLFILSWGSGIHVAYNFAHCFAGVVEWDAFDVLDTAESESVGSSWAFSCPSGSILELLGSLSNVSWAFVVLLSFL